MHRNFVSMSAKINIPDAKFIICGDGFDKDKIQKKVRSFDKKSFSLPVLLRMLKKF
jgi:hypothetical protein